ncbi:hypothetical protein J3D54_002129 [Pseudomonas sp. GGS8]|uniref:hypothetical protein n=1 Tax=Pseudomonas sp. GGS8 TaxID=2817892 RepID=UPI00209E326A|nr:hypothetical protein [Pseudomonas sp. GGS8]MCP1442997.1 hypothetical protein [Pseudomonas sp. GGS8]
MKNQDQKFDDDQRLSNIPSTKEFLAIKSGDIVVDEGSSVATSVRYKYFKLEGGKYSIWTLGLDGSDNNDGDFWNAPDKSKDPVSYEQMLSFANPEAISTSFSESFTVLRKKFSISYDLKELTLLGIFVKPNIPA